MKIARYKKASKTLSFYKNNFGFRTPYQILIDATFCQAALVVNTPFTFRYFVVFDVNKRTFCLGHSKGQISIRDQIPKYFQAETILVTTQCIILEAEGLGAQVQGATGIVKQFLVHKCGHEKSPVSGIACIKSIVRELLNMTSPEQNWQILCAIPDQKQSLRDRKSRPRATGISAQETRSTNHVSSQEDTGAGAAVWAQPKVRRIQHEQVVHIRYGRREEIERNQKERRRAGAGRRLWSRHQKEEKEETTESAVVQKEEKETSRDDGRTNDEAKQTRRRAE